MTESDERSPEASGEAIRVHSVVERKHPSLPRFVVVPSEDVADWKLEGTTMIEASIDGIPIGRRSLKHWGGERDCWFLDLTGVQCSKAGVDTGDAVALELRRASMAPPEAITRLIAANPAAHSAWQSLSPARRRQLAEHVRAAKRDGTKVRRARKALLGERR